MYIDPSLGRNETPLRQTWMNSWVGEAWKGSEGQDCWMDGWSGEQSTGEIIIASAGEILRDEGGSADRYVGGRVVKAGRQASHLMDGEPVVGPSDGQYRQAGHLTDNTVKRAI